MKFLDSFTPADINELCKQFKVKIRIEAIHKDTGKDVLVHRVPIERPPGSGNIVIEEVTEKWEQIELQSTREIRSWHDLFQSDGTTKYDINYPYFRDKYLPLLN